MKEVVGELTHHIIVFFWYIISKKKEIKLTNTDTTLMYGYFSLSVSIVNSLLLITMHVAVDLKKKSVLFYWLITGIRYNQKAK